MKFVVILVLCSVAVCSDDNLLRELFEELANELDMKTSMRLGSPDKSKTNFIVFIQSFYLKA